MRLTGFEDVIIDLLRGYTAYVIFPLLLWLWYGKAKSKLEWIVRAVLMSSLVVLADQITWWSKVSHYFRLVSIIILVLSITLGYIKNSKLPFGIQGYKNMILPVISVLLILGIGYYLLSCIKARLYDEIAINMDFPLKMEYIL